MSALTAEEIAYVAGVIDVMGRVRTREIPDGATLPYLAVSCPNMPLLEYLGALSGTTPFVTKRTYDRHRCTQHCVEPHQHVVSASGRWSVSGAKATVMLNAALPYLRFQKEEVNRVLEETAQAPMKPATLKKMTDLGWPKPWISAEALGWA